MFQAIEKYLIIGGVGLILILGAALKLSYSRLDKAKEENLSLKAQIEAYKVQSERLNGQITAFNESDKKSNQTIYKLRQEVAKFKESQKNEEAKCNCYELPIPDAVLQLLDNETGRAAKAAGKTNS